MARIFCTKCSTKLAPSDSKCPKCGSPDRFIDDSPVFPLDKLTFGIIDKSQHSKKGRYLYETTIKPDYDRDTQQDTLVIRHFNRQKDCISIDGSYVEEIKTRDKKLLKVKTGKLSEHQGHGDDRKNRQHKDPINGGDPDA